MLFSGSSQLYKEPANMYDVLVVDEAHRLKGKGAYQYFGENQIEDIIKASKVNVFFIDDFQRIRPEDIGSIAEIKRLAKVYNSEVHEYSLAAQFRCSGAEVFSIGLIMHCKFALLLISMGGIKILLSIN